MSQLTKRALVSALCGAMVTEDGVTAAKGKATFIYRIEGVKESK